MEAVTKSFGGVRAVRGATFQVEEGTVTGLIGPNGAGKSTVIDLISGQLPADSGRIRFAGREILGLPPYQVSRAGLMRTFQISREWGGLTVLENLVLAGLDPRRASIWRAAVGGWSLRDPDSIQRSRAREVAAQLGLRPVQNAMANTLSGGQKRLLEFGRALMARPRMLVLDEPLAGVSPSAIPQVLSVIEVLKSEGITILMVEHSLTAVARVCSTAIVLVSGSVFATGPVGEVWQRDDVRDAYLGSAPDAV